MTQCKPYCQFGGDNESSSNMIEFEKITMQSEEIPEKETSGSVNGEASKDLISQRDGKTGAEKTSTNEEQEPTEAEDIRQVMNKEVEL